MDKRLEQIEKLTRQIEGEKDFDKMVALFGEATELIKQSLSQTTQMRGRVMEIVRELDEYIEKELKDQQC